MATLPQFANASSYICFDNLSSAKSAAADLKYLKQNSDFYTTKYSLCDAERINLSGQVAKLTEHTDLLKQDKILLNQAADEYKKLYVDTNAALVKSQANTPSRFTWFGVGAITTAVVGLFTIFAVRK